MNKNDIIHYVEKKILNVFNTYDYKNRIENGDLISTILSALWDTTVSSCYMYEIDHDSIQYRIKKHGKIFKELNHILCDIYVNNYNFEMFMHCNKQEIYIFNILNKPRVNHMVNNSLKIVTNKLNPNINVEKILFQLL